MTRDLEIGMTEMQYVKGYPSLASFISSDKDRSTAIYRRFDGLAARNILYLQSELAELEAQQKMFDAEDVNGSMLDKTCARNWSDFKRISFENEKQKERMQLAMDIRKTLKEYSKFPDACWDHDPC
jgi:hypothetical protein